MKKKVCSVLVLLGIAAAALALFSACKQETGSFEESYAVHSGECVTIPGADITYRAPDCPASVRVNGVWARFWSSRVNCGINGSS